MLVVGGSTSEPVMKMLMLNLGTEQIGLQELFCAAAAWGSSAGTYDSGIVFKWLCSETFCWNGNFGQK